MPCRGLPTPMRKLTVPAGGIYLAYQYFGVSEFVIYANASAPIRVLRGIPPSPQLPDLHPTDLSPSSYSGGVNCGVFTTVVDYRVGDLPPKQLTCEPFLPLPLPMESVTPGTDDGNPWLQASPVPGSDTKFTVSMDPAGLALGSHVGVVTAALSGAPIGSVSTTFKLNVHAEATIAAQIDPGLRFAVPSPVQSGITVTSTSPSVPITVSSSESWLIVTPTSATTPARREVSVAPSAPIGANAMITIRGPGNSLVLSAGTFGYFPGGNLAFRSEEHTSEL